jgi:hypothetical protein
MVRMLKLSCIENILYLTLSISINRLAHSQSSTLAIDDLDILYDFLSNNQSFNRVGFLSASNYISVRRKLPQSVKPVYIEHKEDLISMVLNGSLVAALTSGMPEKQYHEKLHIFSSTIVTMQAILMAPDCSTSTPHGVDGDLSAYHLSQLINAAIARVQYQGIDLQIANNNPPKEIIMAHTCKDDDLSQFAIPNRNEAQGLLRDILDNKVIRVLTTGAPPNWGNDGNYLVNPPVGFYPDLLQAIVDQFENMSGPDNVPYGKIRIERFYPSSSSFPWYKLFDGSMHITEPYFILDAPYFGSGKNCTTSSDCPNANMPGGKETCSAGGFCKHQSRPRFTMLRSSCTVLGTESKFFTKREQPITYPILSTSTIDQTNNETTTTTDTVSIVSITTSEKLYNQNQPTDSALDGSIIAVIVILAVLVVFFGVVLAILIQRERQGYPFFSTYTKNKRFILENEKVNIEINGKLDSA